jgi:hypothetical protein
MIGVLELADGRLLNKKIIALIDTGDVMIKMCFPYFATARQQIKAY